MDDRQFDELSKHLSTGLSRKGILRLLGGVGAAGISAASVLLPAEAKKKRARKKNNHKGHDKNDNDDNAAAAQSAQAEARKAKGKGKKGKGKGKKKKHKNTQGSAQPTLRAKVVQSLSSCTPRDTPRFASGAIASNFMIVPIASRISAPSFHVGFVGSES